MSVQGWATGNLIIGEAGRSKLYHFQVHASPGTFAKPGRGATLPYMQVAEQRTGLSWRAMPLYAAFAGTGVGMALPGALLPALLTRWHLGDAAGGRVFLAAWLGSSLGALLVRGSLRLRLVGGSLAIAVGSAGLGMCNGFWVNAWFALYGLGLGMTMTAISLMRQGETTQSGPELIRLNLFWAIGACACPSLALRALAFGSIKPLPLGLAGWFVGVATWAAFQPQNRLTARSGWSLSRVIRKVPLPLILMVCLITGIEASAGGWLATYSRREGHGLVNTIAAPTFLWAGLLVSRLFWSLRTRIAAGWVVRGSLALMAGSALLLLTGVTGWIIVAGAFLLGVGIGPVYPLVLNRTLLYDRGGAIFFLAGLGSAFVPWLTGMVSGWTGSLKLGLLVPGSAIALMLGFMGLKRNHMPV